MESVGKRSEWLWPLSRAFGLLPMTLNGCRCGHGGEDPTPRTTTTTVYGATRGAAKRVALEACHCPPLSQSTVWLVYSVALMFVLVVWTSVGLSASSAREENELDLIQQGVSNIRNASEQDATKHFVSVFDVVSIAFIASVCVLQAVMTQDLVLSLIVQLKKVDSLLPAARHGVSKWLLFCVVCLSFVELLDALHKLCLDWWFALGTVPTYVSYLVTYIREVMFVDDVNSVRARFKIINAELMECLSTDVHADNRGRVAAAERRRDRIARLAAAFDMLCQCVESVARQYSLFLLCDMLGLLVRLVITTYFIIGILASVNDIDPNRTQFVIIQFLWLAGHFARMFVLVTPCSATMEETNRTGAIVSSYIGFEPLDGNLSQQLKSLSVHLLHRKIAFSAFGVFDLSLPLVCTVMSSVTTYLVVLIQLQMQP